MSKVLTTILIIPFRDNGTQSDDNMIAYEIHIIPWRWVRTNSMKKERKKKEDTYTEVSESRGHNSRKTDKWRASRPRT